MIAERFPASVFLTAVCCAAFGGGVARGEPIPIVYSSDLYHPHGDPDDHFDLMTLFCLPEFDIRAIVIDTGEGGKNRPGIPALKQVMHITDRQIPYATGLESNLKTCEDTCVDQPKAAQAGVDLIIEALREADRPVTVFTTGSLRDMAAAYNRDPNLFEAKVARFYVNAGHSTGKGEWNVRLDRHAYVRILSSGLPIYWVPCFGDGPYASHWKFKQGDVLISAPKPVQNFFVYALTKADPNKQDPIAALAAERPQAVLDNLWKQERNMWCTGAFLDAAGRPHPSFCFEEVTVRIEDDGTTNVVDSREGVRLRTFRVTSQETYADAMMQQLKELFALLSFQR